MYKLVSDWNMQQMFKVLKPMQVQQLVAAQWVVVFDLSCAFLVLGKEHRELRALELWKLTNWCLCTIDLAWALTEADI